MNDQRMTDEERQIAGRWERYGADCIRKVRGQWDSTVPNSPLFKTKREAFEFLSTFVLEIIPIRCSQRSRPYTVNER